jgi:predicted AlkP superfamily phosphohydrolase/phosphomutase
MELYSHIVINRKNQEEIFASLSRSDFQKIIENLDDDSERTHTDTQA